MKKIIALGIVVLIVVLVWTGGWFFLAGQVRQQIEALALADGVATPRLTCEGLDVTGFPFRFDADCSNARLVSGDVVADIAGVRASVLVYRPTHILASALGPVTISDAFTGTKNSLNWSGLEASLRLDNWRIARLSVSVHDAVWSDTLMGDTIIAQSPLVELHLLDIPEQHDAAAGLAALAGYVQVQGLSYPGMTIADGNAQLEIELNALPDDIRRFGDVDLLRNWQAANGQLKLVSLRADDGAANLNAEGTINLDNRGRVEGRITMTSNGVVARLEPVLVEPYRTLVFGNPGADGNHANTVNFRLGRVFSGVIPIGAIPPLF